MNNDSIINTVFFIVGLAIGLLQLYVGQHQFEIQQREKMDELRKILSDIQQKLVILESVSSQRSFELQDKLIGLATGEKLVTDFTNDTSKKLSELFDNKIRTLGVQKPKELSLDFNKKASHILETSATSLVDYSKREFYKLNNRYLLLLQLVSEGKKDQEISSSLGVSIQTVKNMIRMLQDSFDVDNRLDLIKKYSELGKLRE